MISDAIYMTTSRPTFHITLCTLQLIHKIYRGGGVLMMFASWGKGGDQRHPRMLLLSALTSNWQLSTCIVIGNNEQTNHCDKQDLLPTAKKPPPSYSKNKTQRSIKL